MDWRTNSALALLRAELKEASEAMTDGLSDAASSVEEANDKLDRYSDRLSLIEIKLDRALQLLATEWHGKDKAHECVDKLAGRPCQCRCQ